MQKAASEIHNLGDARRQWTSTGLHVRYIPEDIALYSDPTFFVHILLTAGHDFHFVRRDIIMAGEEHLSSNLESRINAWTFIPSYVSKARDPTDPSSRLSILS
jgi:hypothetical protein